MGKIKLNLPTGSNVEKSLINCFKVDNVTYVVLDAASVGSMGLPIILVSKFENNRLVKITEQDEWTKVKGFLKEIISGVKKDFVKLDSVLDADEIFYTQLTLPVASFDSLKKSYEENLVNLTSQDGLELTNSTVDVLNQNSEVSVNDSVPSASTAIGVEPAFQGVPESINSSLESSSVNDNVNNIVQSSGDLVLPSIPDNSQSETSEIQNNEVAVNPLLNDNSLPVLELPENQSINDNLNINDVKDLSENENMVNSNVNEVPIPVKEGVDLSNEKEEFLKYCSEFFDKIIDKVKNN